MAERQVSEDEDELLAAELALGLLEGGARASALRRRLEEPAFRDRVERWQRLAYGWVDEPKPDTIDERLWERLRLLAANANDQVEPPKRLDERHLPYWRAFGIGSAAAALALAVALGIVLSSHRGTEPSKAPSVAQATVMPNVAQISGSGGAPLVSAVYYPEKGALVMRVADFGETRKAPELWVLDKKGTPHSLGLVDQDKSLTIDISPELRRLLNDGATMAITLESRDGAPHDKPTGQILGTAKLKTL